MENVVKEFINGQTPSRNHPEYWEGDIPWVSSGELNYNIITNTNEKISETGKQSANLQLLPKGTLLIAITGLEAAGTRGSCAILGIEATTNQSCMALIPDTKKITRDFLYNWYLKIGEKYGIKYTQGTKQQSYNIELLKKLPIRLPKTIEEQNSLTKLLTLMDKRIEFMEKKYKYLINTKKYFLKNMFCYKKNLPNMRFNGFDEEWNVIKLKDCCTITMGQSPSSTNYTNNSEDTILIQGNQELKGGIVVPRVYTTEITKISSPGDIILTVRAPVGDIAINSYNACIGRGVCSLSDMDNNIFIYYYLEYLSNKHIWNRYSQGSTFESINSKDIKNLKIKFPSFKEQNKISDLISAIDDKISFIEKELKIQKNFKKLLLSKMFC